MDECDNNVERWRCSTEDVIGILETKQSTQSAIAYFAVGLTDPDVKAALEHLEDESFKPILLSRGVVNPDYFLIVDPLRDAETDQEVRYYRVLILLESIRNRAQEAVVHALAGTNYDPSIGFLMGKTVKDVHFKHSTKVLHEKSFCMDLAISQEYREVWKALVKFYHTHTIDNEYFSRAADECDKPWLVRKECLPATSSIIHLMIRHDVADSDPQIFLVVESSIPEHVVNTSVEEQDSQFNCDFNNLSVEETATSEKDEKHPRIVTLCIEAAQGISRLEFQFPCAHEDETLQDVLAGFALSFPMYQNIHSVMAADRITLIVSDEMVRNTCEFWHVVEGNEVRGQVEDSRDVLPVFSRAQFQVAHGIFKAVSDRLRLDGKDIGEYSSLSCTILVPKFNSLKQQTIDRINACANLAKPSTSFKVGVELYPSSASSEHLQEVLGELRGGKPDKSKLFVFVVDECHWGPSPTAIEVLHDPTIRAMHNVIVVLVSATPYNCLSTNSRVPAGNIKEWRDLVDPNDTPSYIGFEYYFRSIAFALPFDPQNPQERSLRLSVNGRMIEIVLDPFREYADVEELAAVLTQKAALALIASGITLTCTCNRKGRVVFTVRPQPPTNAFPRVELHQEGESALLRKLGFVDPVVFAPGRPLSVTAPNAHTVSNHVTLVSQHLREDSHFAALRECITSTPECHMFKRISDSKGKKGEKGKALLPVEWCKGLSDFLQPREPLKYKPMAAKNGFTIILDYILSIAYFGSCRVNPSNDATPTQFELQEIPAEPVVTMHHVDRFLEMLARCCYFDDPRSKQSCNITDALCAALNSLCRSAKEEKVQPDNNHCLAYILQQKQVAERLGHTTSDSESWYTETDRIVRMLVTERAPAPMVLMRVYDNDENQSMQIVLRNALKVCGLVRERLPQCDQPAFSVISDTSETNLLAQLEDYFRYQYNVAEGGGAELHVQDLVAQRERANQGNQKRANLDLKYEDLLNIPCLVILCEKGRMGDTFPHTLRALDLRLRTGGTASCFLQEIGRMCRYPRTGNAVLVNDQEEANETFFAQSDEPHRGVTVSAARTGQFLGVAYSAEKVASIVSRSNANFPVLLAPIKHPLPYALIDSVVMPKIRAAVNKREAEIADLQAENHESTAHQQSLEGLRRDTRILTHLKMSKGVDSYLKGTGMQPALSYRLKENQGHYDQDNNARIQHERRFLLSAECQVGKTGAYLHLLGLLRDTIVDSREHLQPPPLPPAVPRGDAWHRWLIPQRLNLSEKQPGMLYDFPKKGKYHACIARQRLAQVQRLLAQYAAGTLGFENEIQKYERTVSNRGLKLLREAADRFADLLQEFEQSATLEALWEKICEIVNWDGRFDRDGTWHPCIDQLRNDFLQWNRSAVPVTRAQTVMFGEHPSVTLLDAEIDALQEEAEDPPIMPLTQVAQVVPVQSADAGAGFEGCAKTVQAYLRTADAMPSKDCDVITLDDFLLFPSTAQTGGQHLSEEVVRLSIPRAALRNAETVLPLSSAQLGDRKLKDVLHSPRTIQSWIFTPSYCGTTVGPHEKLLMRNDAFALNGTKLERWRDYAEVLVVRASQLAAYQQHYGGTHIIAAMPDTMACGTELDMNAADHGCGYSRRFSQLLADYLDLPAIWMVDDYVLRCWKMVCLEPTCARNNVKVEPATFAEVMTHVEALFPGCFNNSATTYPAFAQREEEAVQETERASLQEIVEPFDKYGIIGMARGYQWRGVDVAHPVKKSYSVYSFFLLNVKETVKNGLFFPARPIWEDIEFNNLLDENGLLVCKLQVFAHEKKIHSPAAVDEIIRLQASQVLPMPPAEELLSWLCGEGYNVCHAAGYCESAMLHPEQNALLAELEQVLPSEPVDGAVHFTLAHNAGVRQVGVFAGTAIPNFSLQSCVDAITEKSEILQQAVNRVGEGEQSVHWVMLLPKLASIDGLGAPLRVEKCPAADVWISFQYRGDAILSDELIVVVATVTCWDPSMEMSDAVPAAPMSPVSPLAPLAEELQSLQVETALPAVAPPPERRSPTKRKRNDRLDDWMATYAEQIVNAAKQKSRTKDQQEVMNLLTAQANEVSEAPLTEQALVVACRKWRTNAKKRERSAIERASQPDSAKKKRGTKKVALQPAPASMRFQAGMRSISPGAGVESKGNEGDEDEVPVNSGQSARHYGAMQNADEMDVQGEGEEESEVGDNLDDSRSGSDDAQK